MRREAAAVLGAASALILMMVSAFALALLIAALLGPLARS